jgi:cytochrome P450
MTTAIQSSLPATDDLEIDLYSASSFSDGHPTAQYAWLRRNAPVYQHPAPDGGYFWAVTRYHDIQFVERNPEIFSAAPTVLITDTGMPGGFLSSDDPQHAQYRRVVAPRLVPYAVRERLPSLATIASEIVDDIQDKGECELVEDVAACMAGYTAADFLGMPRADGRRLHDLYMILHSSPDVKGEEAIMSAAGELMAMGQAVFAEKRKNPKDDVYSAYANLEVDGELITEHEFLGNFILLTDGSLDTSRNLISGGMLLLMRHPEQRERLVSDFDGMMPAAINEMLRFLSPVVYIRRVATSDTEIAGQPIAKGDRVAIYFGSGNRDEAVFADPEALDISRTPNEHIAFGSAGPHFCVGAHLGRAEGRVMLRELLTRLPDIQQSGPETWAATSLTSGLASLPASFTPTKRT